MPFETIENCKPVNMLDAIPSDGVRIGPRRLESRGTETVYIKLQIGVGLAKKLVLTGEKVALALAFGTGRDAGKIRVSVDVKAGQFVATRDKKGGYSISINKATAEGLFALDFPVFAVPEVEVVHAQGQPPAAIVEVSEQMLAVDD